MVTMSGGNNGVFLESVWWLVVNIFLLTINKVIVCDQSLICFFMWWNLFTWFFCPRMFYFCCRVGRRTRELLSVRLFVCFHESFCFSRIKLRIKYLWPSFYLFFHVMKFVTWIFVRAQALLLLSSSPKATRVCICSFRNSYSWTCKEHNFQ